MVLNRVHREPALRPHLELSAPDLREALRYFGASVSVGPSPSLQFALHGASGWVASTSTS